MATREYEIQVSIDGVVEEVHSAACFLLALGRERLLTVAEDYLMTDDPDVAAELGGATLDELALCAAGRAFVCQKLGKLRAAARAALEEMSPEQQLAAARERAPVVTRPGKLSQVEVELQIPSPSQPASPDGECKI
jgi:hypothetical protein